MATLDLSRAPATGPDKKPPYRRPLREYFELALSALFIALLVRVSVVQAYHVPTGSMKGTILSGDYLLVNQFIYGIRTPDSVPFTNMRLPHFRFPALKDPRPGEIVVFKFPPDPTQNYVKRCIAVPGQTVEIRDGIVYVDGRPEGRREQIGEVWDEEEGTMLVEYRITRENGGSYHIRHYADHDVVLEQMAPVQVPEGHYFMLGDNRDNSYDSRSWGFVPRDNVVGEALVVYWSTTNQIPPFDLVNKIRWQRIGTLLQ